MAFSPATGDVQETKFDTRITIKFDDGTSGSLVTSKTYQNVKVSATALEKYNFGLAIAYLTDMALNQINTGDTIALTASA